MGEEGERGSDDEMEELLKRQTLTCHIHVHRCTHTTTLLCTTYTPIQHVGWIRHIQVYIFNVHTHSLSERSTNYHILSIAVAQPSIHQLPYQLHCTYVYHH